MMRSRASRAALATLVAISMIVTASASWAGTERDVHTDPGAESTSPVTFDLLVLRPAGLLGLLIGTALFIAPVAPLTLITKPGDIGRPFKPMVVVPAAYVFRDPLGEH